MADRFHINWAYQEEEVALDGEYMWAKDYDALMETRNKNLADGDIARLDLCRAKERIRELEQFRDWAEPQIVMHGEDTLRIEALKAHNSRLRGAIEDYLDGDSQGNVTGLRQALEAARKGDDHG